MHLFLFVCFLICGLALSSSSVSANQHRITLDQEHIKSRHSLIVGHHHDADNIIFTTTQDHRWIVHFSGEKYETANLCEGALAQFVQFVQNAINGSSGLYFRHLNGEQHKHARHCGDTAVFITNTTSNQMLSVLSAAQRLHVFGLEWFEQQHLRRRHHRDTTAALIDKFAREPLWRRQWHLHDSSVANADYWTDSGLAPNHLHVVDAWRNHAVFGAGVVVAVVDDGLDFENPEFASSYSAQYSYDFDDNNANPQPYVYDSHGTKAAALIAARENGVCGVGVAPRSSIVGIRLIAKDITDSTEARGLTYFDDKIDIYSNSWGPQDDGRRLDGPGPVTQIAMERAVAEGRSGRGTVYVWAAGNGKQMMDSCNYDGFANSRLVIPVCAVDFMSAETEYSEWCSTLLVCAPSSGSRGPSEVHGIATASLHVPYSETGCDTGFGGTSAAAPLVAGVVALMLEARPELSWRDVQHILARTAVRNDHTHRSWMRNAASIWVSHSYGFGVVNAEAAVALAKIWTLLPRNSELPQCINQTSAVLPHVVDEMLLSAGATFEFPVNDSGRVEFVEIYFSMTHPRRGDIEARLYSPAGTLSELASTHLDNNEDFRNWRFGSRIPFGEDAAGTWKLQVLDTIPNGKVGAVTDVCIRVFTY